MDTEYGRDALDNRKLYEAIVQHRRIYYALKYVNYDLHAPATIDFMVPSQSIETWSNDYAEMCQYFIYGTALPFERLLKRLMELQERIRQM